VKRKEKCETYAKKITSGVEISVKFDNIVKLKLLP